MKLRMMALLFAAGAATTTIALAQDAAAPPAAAITTKSGTIGPAAAGKGQVVFYRPGSMMGMALGCTVRENGVQVARLGSGKYFVVTAEPGRHVYTTQSEATDVLTMEVEPGETYFVKCRIGSGIMAGRPNISPSDAAEFAAKARGLRLWAGGAEAQ